MRHTTRSISIETLRPVSQGDRRALYELVRNELVRSGTFHVDLARKLSIAAVRHLAGEGGRILLRGAPGTGKKVLARTFGEVLDLPQMEVDAAMLAQMNWAGADLGFFLERFYSELTQQYPPRLVPAIAEHACVFVHSLDSVRIPGAYTGMDVTRDDRDGRQQSLATLCSGGSIPVSTRQGRGFVWSGSSALVIIAADFDGLSSGRPDADDLIAWGLTPSLSRALAAFSFLEVTPLSRARLEDAVRLEASSLRKRFLGFGFHLYVTDQAIRYVTDAIWSGRNSGGPSAASKWIEEAAEAALIRLLEGGAPLGARFTLARDDVSLPEPNRGLWRE